ncbi:hypothetical protein Leryth_027248 [Lithospermum erythrorhizon]|uniref:non-specific serine/threonine protein kinase n=1 Tax=Lithospermum erythrorhizon TaxID=34254 RepID=A0AAV3Q9Z0_LITER|nr:hypothetical protein Leryth_027248 [Lithospermum erythrorhizon]
MFLYSITSLSVLCTGHTMKSLISFVQSVSFVIVTFLFLTHLSSFDASQYAACGNVFSCGMLTGIDYPFYGVDRPIECGYPGFELDCDDEVATMEMMGVKYRVLDINQGTQTLSIAREDLTEDICQDDKIISSSLDSRLFEHASNNYLNVTILYGCPETPGEVSNQFSCAVDGTANSNGYIVEGVQGPANCLASVVVPVRNTSFQGPADFGELLAQGIEIRSKVDNTVCNECKNSSGRCGFNQTSTQFTCLCDDQTLAPSLCLRWRDANKEERFQVPADTANDTLDDNSDGSTPETDADSESGNSTSQAPLAVGLSVAGAVVAGIGIGWFFILFIRQRRKRIIAAKAFNSNDTESRDLKAIPSSKPLMAPFSNFFTKSIPSYPSPKSEIGRGGSTYFGVQIFNYNDLQQATDNFNSSRELGDGGFGAVYHGNLPDGRVVAVKRLYENNFKRVEQFMNEVEILARLRHQNLVQLFGCTSKKSPDLLLVYEYIPNGTVADHLHGKRANSGLLTWPVRLKIAVETADALAYLHSSEIIHRDVKTTNVLLDNDFNVKVADFGLSRLFPTNVTHVSTAPQGTPGYVDPEYYQVYQLTEKSDVYSFGVVLGELISSLEAVDTNRHKHDINLASMTVNKIKNHALDELVDGNLGFTTNSSVRRMITVVAELAFRCLQQERDMRPSMKEVLESLRDVQNQELRMHNNEEVVEIVVDDVALVKGYSDPPSQMSVLSDNHDSSASSSM